VLVFQQHIHRNTQIA